MNNPPFCPYCNESSILVDSAKVYGRSYGWMYVCQRYPGCDAYVGCHKGTTEPLGRLANKELRSAKRAAHDAFDPLWRAKIRLTGCSKKTARTRAYAWLAGELGISFDDCHIGMFDVETCKRVAELCSAIPQCRSATREKSLATNWRDE